MTAGETLRKALVVDGDKATTALIRSLLLDARRFATTETTDIESFWQALETMDPEIILIVHSPPAFDCAAITRKLRFSELPSRQRPIIMLAERRARCAPRATPPSTRC